MERRLVAILVADVVGYSRLMGEDEAGTLESLKVHRREIMDPSIAAFHGRIIKLMGDGTLVEFASVVDAVKCAVAIQRALVSADGGSPSGNGIQLRIGINLGDVMVEGDDLYGDGVNVAARLEALAEPGGICISGTAYDHAVHKAGVSFESLGELRLKNIADPVRAYRVLFEQPAPRRASRRWPNAKPGLLAGIAIALAALVMAAVILWRAPPDVPDRPSLAVLPFTNLSGVRTDEYFADGITEDLTTELAKLSGIDVIARNSSFKYKDQSVAPKDVGRDLGVSYIVEGSVRRNDDDIRINAQLIDAASGGLIWADKYDRKASDVFVVQDELVGAIIAALGVKPTTAEAEVLARLPTSNLEAYDYYLRGEQAARNGSSLELRRALEFFVKAEALDPSFADAFAADARTSVFIWRNTYDNIMPIPVAKKRAYEQASRALELNPRASDPHATLAVLQAVDGQYEQAIASARRGVALGPNNVDALIALGFVLASAGQHAEATAAILTAQRLDPNLSATDRQTAGLVFFLDGKFKEAIATLEQAKAEAPNAEEIYILLAAAYAAENRLDEARQAIATYVRSTPFANVEYFSLTYSYFRNAADRELLIDALTKAGLPQWPSDFQGDEQNRLSSKEIKQLMFGHIVQGRLSSGSPALMQVSNEGKMVFRTDTLLMTGIAYISNGKFCQQSESLVTLRRATCGPIFRNNPESGKEPFTYVNATEIFHFKSID